MFHRLLLLTLLTLSQRQCRLAPVRAARRPLQGRYAERVLNYGQAKQAPARPVRVDMAINASLGAEAFSIQRQRQRLSITGGDARGLIYGALEAREQLQNGTRSTA